MTGGDLWVANSQGNSLTEINVHTGSIVRTVGSPSYGFNSPQSIATNGKFLWVANSNGHSVTEVSAQNGALIRVIDPSVHRLDYPSCVVYVDGNVWVSTGGNLDHNAAMIELNPATGATERTVTKGMYSIEAVAVIGQDIWVGNLNNTVTELGAESGSLVRVINLKGLGTGVEPIGFVRYMDDVWIANGSSSDPGTNYGMVELRASNGAVLKKILSSSLGFDTAQGVKTDGANVWIATTAKVVEMNAATGALENVIQDDGISYPEDFAVVGHTIWISNGTGGHFHGSVTELSLPSGRLIRVIQ